MCIYVYIHICVYIYIYMLRTYTMTHRSWIGKGHAARHAPGVVCPATFKTYYTMVCYNIIYYAMLCYAMLCYNALHCRHDLSLSLSIHIYIYVYIYTHVYVHAYVCVHIYMLYSRSPGSRSFLQEARPKPSSGSSTHCSPDFPAAYSPEYPLQDPRWNPNINIHMYVYAQSPY